MAGGSSCEILLVEVAGTRFGVPADVVRELVRCVGVTPSGASVGGAEGVIDVRGEVVPVVGLRERLGLEAREPTPSDHMVIARCEGRAVALRVDRAIELVRLGLAAGESGGGALWAQHPGGLVPVLGPEALAPPGGRP